MSGFIAEGAAFLAGDGLAIVLAAAVLGGRAPGWGTWAVVFGITAGAEALFRWSPAAAFDAAAALFCAWMRYRRRRDRKRACGLTGAKSRALRDALVRKAREAAAPRPVLRPAPGGAR